MPLQELTTLLQRWQASGGRLERARVVRDGATLLRTLTDGERQELAHALADQGLVELADRVDTHLPGAAGAPLAAPAFADLLALEPGEMFEILDRLGTGQPPPPPPAPAEGTVPEPPPGPDPAPLPDPAPPTEPLPAPEPLPPPDPLPAPDPLPEPDPLPAADTSHTTGTPDVGPVIHPGDATPLPVLDAVPDGWKRRRTALRLLEEGALDDLDPALVLSRFGRDGDRTRVAAALLRMGRLAPDELRAQLPHRTARRLARRVAR